MNVSWQASAGTNGYIIQWKSGSQRFLLHKRVAELTVTSYSIRGLVPGVSYTVRITPFANAIVGAEVEASATPVGARIVVTAPSPLTEDGLANGALVFVALIGLGFPADESLTTISVAKPSGLRITRRVFFTETETQVGLTVALGENTDFDEDTALSISVNIPNWSLTTQTVPIVATVETAPGKVTGVVVTPDVESLNLTWNRVPDALLYRVQWRDGAQAWGSTSPGAGESLVLPTRAKIGSLTAGTTYTVRVVATKGRASDGPPSDEHTGTPRVRIDPDLNLQAADLIAHGVDEGGARTYTVALNVAPAGAVTVAIASDQAAVAVEPAQLAFATTTWNSAQTVTATSSKDDNAVNEIVTLTHDPSGPGYDAVADKEITFVVNDNDRPGLVIDTAPALAGNQTGVLALIERSPADKAKPYTVRLASAPTEDVVVTIVSGESAVVVAPTRLTFSPSAWNTAQTVTATAQDDSDSNDALVAIDHSASGGDYSTMTAMVRVKVTDSTGPAVVMSAESLTLREGGQGTYLAKLNMRPTGLVTIAATVDGSRTVAMAMAQPTLTFTTTNWTTSRAFTVRAASDADSNAESAVIRHVARGGGYDEVAVPAVSVSVVDVDSPALVLDAILLTAIAGSTVDYQVSLATRPTGTVTVRITTTGPISASPAELTYSANAWNLHQTVRVQANAVVNEKISVARLSHTASGGGYDGQSADLSVHVLRPDTPGVSVNTTALAVNEGNQASYALRLDTRPYDTVTVTINASSAAAYTVPTTVTFTTDNWNRSIAVTVQTVADDDEEDEVVTLAHAVAGYDDVTTGPTLIVTINDRPSLATLSALAIFPGELRPTFDPATQNYTASMAENETEATVTAVAAAPNARIVITPPDASASPGHQVALVSAFNDVVVRVFNDEQVRTYRLRIAYTTSRRPEIAAALPPIAVDVGESTSIDLAAGFRDPDGDRLVYFALSDAPQFATVILSGTRAQVTGHDAGSAVVRVWATDPTNLVATQTVPVAVGNVVQFEETTIAVTEGETAVLTVTMTRSKQQHTPLALSVRHDEDPDTHNADHHDYHTHELALAIPAGHKSATIDFGIHDDEHIEPLTETFMVSLTPADDMPVGPAHTATVTIHEGICDRLLRIQNEMDSTVDDRCETVSAEDLARQTTLDLSHCHDCDLRTGDLDGLVNLRELSLASNGMRTLPPGIFRDMSQLRVLNLSGNRLETLPPGVFEGLAALDAVDLSDNPGTPFTLTVELARQDVAPALPRLATVTLHVAEGAPFPMQARLAMRDAWATDENNAPVTSASIASGQIVGTPFTVRPATERGAWIWPVATPALPRSMCGTGRPCYRGLRIVAGAPLPLFGHAAGNFVAPDLEDVLVEDNWTLMLDEVFADYATVHPLSYAASSSDPSVATVAIRAGMLIVDRDPGGEGPVTITITATNSADTTSTLRFTMMVEFGRRSFLRGWRLALLKQ